MKKASFHTPISLLFCACIAFSQADGVLRSLPCPWWKTVAPHVLCDLDSNSRCCSYLVEIAAFPEDAFHESDKQSDSPSKDGCCDRGCCKLFQPLIFLVTGPPVSICGDNLPSIFETDHSLPHSDFSKSLFRPPRA